ncbi:hypothetical protein B0H14DRAFT_2624318 [Mycena olivaceomarginata]|nr:hypothetical protein B0H14DRAFT_2624318 [Mycena olivaceomarginata]
MVYCPCCSEDVPRATKVRHLRARGWQNVKNYVETHNFNLTSRVLQKLRKRKRPGGELDSDTDDTEEEPPNKFPREASSESPVHHQSPPAEPYPDMAVDQQGLVPPVPTTLPTIRPRLVTVETCSSSGSKQEEDEGPELVLVDDDDQDPELDEALLKKSYWTDIWSPRKAIAVRHNF